MQSTTATRVGTVVCFPQAFPPSSAYSFNGQHTVMYHQYCAARSCHVLHATQVGVALFFTWFNAVVL